MRHYVVQDSFCTFPALAENHTVICIADKSVSSVCEFLIQLIQHDVA